MNLWLVNPFDPLPGDPEQEGRYATLARYLLAAGHELTWWTSAFSHRFKRPVDQGPILAACAKLGIRVRFLAGRIYKNVSFARLANHAELAREFARQGPLEAGIAQPDIVLASAPPPHLAREAGRLARSLGVPFVIDVQDLWPETFYRLAPPALRPAMKLALWPIARAAREGYAAADAVVGVAEAYVNRAIEIGGPKHVTASIPLGADLAEFDAAATRGRCEQFTRPAGEVWLAYTGSLARSYDFFTILRAAEKLRDDKRLRFFITGRGDLAAAAEQFVAEHSLQNVTLTGFLDFPAWAFLLSQCDIGFNASFPEAMIFLPNKVFYYFAAGAAVLNTIPGQCSRIVRDGQAGLDYTAGDVDSCADAIRQLLSSPALLMEMKQRARRMAQTTYDRKILMPQYVRLLERQATHPDRD